MAKEIKRWITVNGNHIPIYEGESQADIQERINDMTGSHDKKDDKQDNNKIDKDIFKEHAEEYVGGGVDVDKVFDKQELEFIKDNMKTTDKPLYRVEDSKYTADKLDIDDLDADDFKFKGSFRSFSSDMDFISSAMDENSDNYAGIENPVIFEITGSKKHFDMEPYTQEYSKQFGSQSESLVGGNFELVGEDMKKINGTFVRIIKIRQKG